MDHSDILIEPVITEKANTLREQDKYVFIVHPEATKTQIKAAIKKLFNVKVVSCTTMNIMGKMKRLRTKAGRTSSYKKAIVRLEKGQTIAAFEGV